MSTIKEKLAAKRETFKDRLAKLSQQKDEAKRLNRQAVATEEKLASMPKNWEWKKRRLEWEERDEEFQQQCIAEGKDPKELKLLEVSADVADHLNAKKRRHQTPEETPYMGREEATYRKYVRLTRGIRPDRESYAAEKERMKECFYPTADTLGLNQRKDTKEGVERMMKDMEEQIEKRKNYRRRRVHDEEATIDYINEKNKLYNERLERDYGKFTEEIKQNLERGTAV